MESGFGVDLKLQGSVLLRWTGKALLALAPPAFAFVAVHLEPVVAVWTKGRAAALPLIMLVIGTSLLNPKMRHLLIITLCYGVTFLALNDTIFHEKQWMLLTSLPHFIDRDLAETVILTGLLIVAGLSAVAALGETLRPGTVWARRCYFGAAALYFGGQGINCFGPRGSWQALVFCVIGVMAAFGCFFADRIVSSDMDEEVEIEVSDESEQRVRDAQHLRALRDKEWQDNSPTAK